MVGASVACFLVPLVGQPEAENVELVGVETIASDLLPAAAEHLC